MKLRVFLVVWLLIISQSLIMAGPAQAEQKERKPLIIVSAELLPFYFKEAGGAHQGILVDFWNLWSERTGIPVSFEITEWGQSIEKVLKGEADVIGGLAFTPERGSSFYFSRPFYGETCNLFYREGLPPLESIEDLDGVKVGVIASDYLGNFIREQQPKAIIKEYPDINQLIEAIIKGDVDALLMENDVAMAYMAKIEGFRSVRSSPFPITTKFFHAAVRKGNYNLLNQLNNGFSAISDDEIRNIVRSWTESMGVFAQVQNPQKVVIACSAGSAPFHFRDENGQPNGMFIDLWKLWSEKTGIEIEFKIAGWGETLNMVRDGRADIHAGVFYSRERDSYLDYAYPLYKCNTNFFYHKSIQGLNKLEDLAGFKVGVIEGDFAVEFIREKMPDLTLSIYPDNEDLFDAVEKGEIRVFIKDAPIAIYHLSRRKILHQFQYNSRNPIYSNMFYAAVKQGNESLFYIVQKGMKTITTEENNAIVRKWIGAEEIKKKDVLVISLPDNYFPFSGFNFEGNPAGMFVDIWKLWAKKTGQKVEFYITSWNETIRALKNDEIDIHSGLYRTAERATWMDFSQPFYNISSSFFSHDPSVEHFDKDKLSGKKIGVMKDSYQELYLNENPIPGIQLFTFSSRESMIQAALDKTIDAYLDEVPVSRNNLERLGVLSEFKSQRGDLFNQKVYAAVKKGNTELLAKIDKGFEEITGPELSEIEKKWIPDPEIRRLQGGFVQIDLTMEEEAWLNEHENILLGVDPNRLPFEKMTSDGQYQGMAADYVRFINERLHINMKPVVGLSWADVMEKVKTGEIDIIPCAVKTPNRSKYLLFTKPCLSFSLIILTRDNYPYISGLDDLKDKKIAVIKYYYSHEVMERDFPDYEIYPVDDIDTALQEVSSGNVDAFIGDLASVSYAIKKLGFTNLKIAATTPYSFDLSFAVRNDWPIMVGILEKALDTITEKEKNRIHASWITIQYEREINWRYIMRIVLNVSGVAAIILAVIIIWNIRLSKEITKRKKAEAGLIKARKAAEEANKSKGDFLANMSHEIRTPMNAIIGMSHLALKTELTPKQSDYLNKIQVSANSLLGIINDILDFSKIEAKKLDLEKTKFDLEDVLNNVSTLTTIRAREKGLEFLVDIDADVPTALIGDPLRLGQILTNLTSNAVKFTEHGEIVIAIDLVSKEPDQVTLKFSVRDTGIGLTKEQASGLFQAFSQADTSTTRKFGGTGLGLAISKQLVNMMNGEIWVESEYGHGSTFAFTAIFDLYMEEEKQLLPPEDMKRLKILLVDDNATSRKILHNMLESFSFEIIEAASGEEGLAELEESEKGNLFDLIIMDWKMPGMDGLKVSELIKNNSKFAQIPIIMVTAYSRDEIKKEAEKIGIESVLIKPVSQSTLFEAIIQVFGYEFIRTTEKFKKTATEAGSPEQLKGNKILLVEDNEINLQVAREILESVGLVVSVAKNGKEAVNAVEENEFDAVLMDIQMPVMDGYEATREIRKKPRFKHLPIIAMSANALAGDMEKSLESGMNDHVSKPIDPELLFETIAKYVSAKYGEFPSVISADLDKEEPVADKDRDATLPLTDLPSDLPGISVKTGLAIVMGNKKLYLKLLREFRDHNAGAAEDIRAALEKADYDSASRKAHTIKGVAGNIGAGNLSRAAGDLEKNIRQNNIPLLSSLLKDCETQLNEVVNSITDIEKQLSASMPKDAPDGDRVTPIDTAVVGSLLAELCSLLETDLAAAMGCFEKLKPYLRASIVDNEFQQLERQIDGFDTDSALGTLKNIAKILNISLGAG